jgi:hypothetical protein
MPFPVTGYPVAEYLFTYPVLPAELLLRESALLPAFHQGKHLGLGSDLCHRFFPVNLQWHLPADQGYSSGCILLINPGYKNIPAATHCYEKKAIPM